MNKKIRIKEVVKYSGHSLSASGSVNFTLKASYSELINTISLMQLLNNDVDIKARLPGQRPFKLGYFRIKQIAVHGDGESTIKFNGLVDHIEMDHLNVLPMVDADNKEFVVLMESEVELEGGDGNEE